VLGKSIDDDYIRDIFEQALHNNHYKKAIDAYVCLDPQIRKQCLYSDIWKEVPISVFLLDLSKDRILNTYEADMLLQELEKSGNDITPLADLITRGKVSSIVKS
jgi:hypothetical protein